MPIQPQKFIARNLSTAGPDTVREERKRLLAAELLRSGTSLKMTALGTSMVPAIWPGDVLTLEPGAEGADVGDIVLFLQNGRFFIHRIAEKNSGTWRTRGDAVSQPDPPITPADVLARVSMIEREGGRLLPCRQRPVRHRVMAWFLCYSDRLRNAALRLNGWRRGPGSMTGEYSY
ncbi:MAG TPA: S24/S26 family peptidase [Terriglobales bacterium]